MFKKFISVLFVSVVILNFVACKKIDDSNSGFAEQKTSVQKITRIHNNFADILPSFKFDSEITENYKEGINYSFSAKCSDSKFEKYIDKVKEEGLDKKASEGNGYYAAYSDDGYYTEITLVNGNITVFVKYK